MLQNCINRLDNKQLFWEDKNTEVDLQEIGPQKDLNYWELMELLLKVMKEFTDPIWLEWEFCHYNSKKANQLIH